MKTYLFILVYIFSFSIDVSAIQVKDYRKLDKNEIAKTLIIKFLCINKTDKNQYTFSLWVDVKDNEAALEEEHLKLEGHEVNGELINAIRGSLNDLCKNKEREGYLIKDGEFKDSHVQVSVSLTNYSFQDTEKRKPMFNRIFKLKDSLIDNIDVALEEIKKEIGDVKNSKQNRKVFNGQIINSLVNDFDELIKPK